MGKAIEEPRYEQLRRLGQELHVPIPEAFWELEVRDKEGKLIQRHRQRCHSWTRNAYNHMFSNLAAKDADDPSFGPGLLSVKHLDGTVYGMNYPFTYGQYSVDGTGNYGMRAAAGEDGRGIVVGSGTAEESFEDCALQTQIANGTGAGQLSYIASEEHSVSYDTPTRVFRNHLVRYFNNNSGGDVNVNEVGIYCKIQQPGSARSHCYSRDKLAATVTVPDTGQLKVTYTVQLAYPA